VVSVTDPYGIILGFLDRSRYFSIKELLSCTHEAEWTPFQTHYFFSGSAGNRTRASGSVDKNSNQNIFVSTYGLMGAAVNANSHGAHFSEITQTVWCGLWKAV
jgi:hypothetical protein